MEDNILLRYTNLASAIHVLRNRCLTLLNPATWTDRNDAFFLAEYKRRQRAESVLALCFTERWETFHHWQVFSPGRDGVCIEFDKAELLDEIAHDAAVEARAVDYKQISEVTAGPIADSDLPFLKRIPYADEREFRLLYVNRDLRYESHEIEISLSAIRNIRLSPWMPESLAEAIKDTLKDIEGCNDLKIYRSTLIDNERWKNAATAFDPVEEY